MPTRKTKFVAATETVNLCLDCAAVNCKIMEDIGPLSECSYFIRLVRMNESVIKKNVPFRDGE